LDFPHLTNISIGSFAGKAFPFEIRNMSKLEFKLNFEEDEIDSTVFSSALIDGASLESLLVNFALPKKLKLPLLRHLGCSLLFDDDLEYLESDHSVNLTHLEIRMAEQLTRFPDISRLLKLRALSIRNETNEVSISGGQPLHFPNLESLSLAATSEQISLYKFREITSLQRLSLHGEDQADKIAFKEFNIISLFSSLKEIFIHGSFDASDFVPTLKRLPNLSSLAVVWADSGGDDIPVPATISLLRALHADKLTVLSLTGFEVDDKIMEIISNFSLLQNLHLFFKAGFTFEENLFLPLFRLSSLRGLELLNPLGTGKISLPTLEKFSQMYINMKSTFERVILMGVTSGVDAKEVAKLFPACDEIHLDESPLGEMFNMDDFQNAIMNGGEGDDEEEEGEGEDEEEEEI